LIEESVTINADIKKVWRMFTDLPCWHEWNKVLTVVSSGEKGEIAKGTSFTFLMRPFAFVVQLEPLAEEVVPCKRIILTGHRFGIRARHDFFFEGNEAKTTVTSRETFTGIPCLLPTWIFVEKRMKKLTGDMLRDLKNAAEKSTSEQKAMFG
jgi:hypothetical protein